MVRYYLFVISSLSHPVYRNVHSKRRAILDRHKIPYSVLINEQESPLHDRSIKTFVPTEFDEILFPIGDWIPSMTQKFLMAVRQYFRSFPSYDDIPDFIVRINATVFIYYPKLEEALESFPRKRLMAGPMYSDDGFIVGMLMIFSKDVLASILADPDIFDKDVMSGPDDTTLTHLGRKYADCHNMIENFVYPSPETLDSDRRYKLEEIRPFDNKKWYFRICDWEDNRSGDEKNWDVLVEYFYPPSSCKSRAWWLWIVLLVVLLILAACVCFRDWKKQP